ncbi:DNA-packaging protein [Sphingomonas sp. FW199]|uniref:DNA-packaging protein n=1 Tax=Sphingomonas sp. FW199 TaxID=3400217 RepID=UPI003CE7A779
MNEAIDALTARSPDEQAALLARMTAGDRQELLHRWSLWAHAGQLAPPGDWRVWVIRAGRGFGKTRAGAEWVSEVARTDRDARIALVAASLHDARQVMVEGPSGILALARPGEKHRWRPALGQLTFASGAVAQCYSAAAGETLRGPEHGAAWCDELAKWPRGSTAWDNLMMGLRIGDHPRAVVTTTPRPIPLLKRILSARDTVETRGATRDNPHLPDGFVAAMMADYGGTALGRQELDGEIIDDLAGALWHRAEIERARIAADAVPEMVRVVVGVDPPATADGDACGIVAVGLGEDGMGHVLADASVAGRSPEGWASAVADCAARWNAECVVAEVNMGGDMVKAVLAGAGVTLNVKQVRASRGKVARAEPVAALYAAGRVRHAGAFPALEDELCGLFPAGDYRGPGRSPDRADALVWAMSELMLNGRGQAALRVLA